jgi:hypothetical protein
LDERTLARSYDVNRALRETGLATYPDVEAPVSKVVEASAGETRVDNEGSGLSGDDSSHGCRDRHDDEDEVDEENVNRKPEMPGPTCATKWE